MFTIDFTDHTGEVNTEWYQQIDNLLTFAKKEENIEDLYDLSNPSSGNPSSSMPSSGSFR